MEPWPAAAAAARPGQGQEGGARSAREAAARRGGLQNARGREMGARPLRARVRLSRAMSSAARARAVTSTARAGRDFHSARAPAVLWSGDGRSEKERR